MLGPHGGGHIVIRSDTDAKALEPNRTWLMPAIEGIDA
jgi:hypothetical protein